MIALLQQNVLEDSSVSSLSNCRTVGGLAEQGSCITELHV
jgi:hypothetical protein